MGARVTGVETLTLQLENVLKRSSRGSREALQKGAEMIAERAKMYAPVDQHNLEDAIKVHKEIDGTTRRAKFYVYVDESHTPATRAPTVGQYAAEMHENRDYKLGQKSQDKANALGVVVGPGYLTRAMQDMAEEVKALVESKANIGVGK